MAKKSFRSVYGATASIKQNRDGSFSLKVSNAYGKSMLSKSYGSERGAKIAMSKISDGWREIK